MRGERRRALLLLALVLGVVLRFWLAATTRGNNDHLNYKIYTTIALRGGDLYTETDTYNYAPLWAHWLARLNRLCTRLDVPFRVGVKLFLTIVDVANALFIGLIVARTGGELLAGMVAYLLNPVAILVASVHGQFDTFAALPLLAGLWLLVRSPERPPTLLIWVLGTLSLLIKHILVFSVLMLFAYVAAGRRRPWLFTGLLWGLAGLVFLASFAPYLPEAFAGIRHNVFYYRGFAGIWGLGALLPVRVVTPIFVAAMLALPFLARSLLRLDAAHALELSAVALLALMHGISEQYFIIPVIFGTARRSPALLLYTAAATLFLLSSPHNLHLLRWPTLWNTVWLAAVAWLLSEFVTWRRFSLTGARATT